MITLNDISFLLVTPVKDLARVQGVYNSVRRLYPYNEIVAVYENNQHTRLNPDDNNLKEIHTNHRVYVSVGYNLALKHCTNKCFVFIHDDTFLARGFLENLIPHVSEKQFCNFTTVEPPLYDNVNNDQRPIADFGRSMDSFNIESFDFYCEKHIDSLKSTIVESPFGGFFMCGYKKSLDSVGGFDESFQPYFYEDADLMIRLHQAGYKFVHVLNSIVYHMGSLTARGTEESMLSEKITSEIFIKKWKTTWDSIRNYTLLNGIPYVKKSVEIRAVNCQTGLLNYVNLINEPGSDTIVSFDGLKINQQDFEYLQTLPYVLQSLEEEGEYEIGELKIKYKKNA
jgi:GT2 family glycosyltransferase